VNDITLEVKKNSSDVLFLPYQKLCPFTQGTRTAMAPITKLSDSLPEPPRHTVPSFSGGDVTVGPKPRKSYYELGENISSYPHERPYDVAIDTAPVTLERMPYVPSEGDELVDPGTVRACIAADKQHPYGTTDGGWAEMHKTETVVQQHCLYFDQDRDGIIHPHDTFIACRKWGWSVFLSALATFIINVNLSYPTQPGWLPDPFFRIYIKNVHKAKHGSDSMSFDNEGRFSPQKYEDLFAKYDRGNKGGLDWRDLLRFHKGQRMAMDFFGWSAVFFECKHIHISCPERSLLTSTRRVGCIPPSLARRWVAAQRRRAAGV
jgi:peroxygenase